MLINPIWIGRFQLPLKRISSCRFDDHARLKDHPIWRAYGDGYYPGNVYDNDYLDLAPTHPPLTDSQTSFLSSLRIRRLIVGRAIEVFC
jgi:hypothetical protein